MTHNLVRKVALTSLIIGVFLPLTTMATAWHYDFGPGEDLSGLTVVNPTGQPTYDLTSTPGTLQMNIPRTGIYDLASWVNNNAIRMYRPGGGEAFTLETKLSSSLSQGTWLTGLFLVDSSDGDTNSLNDILFAVNPTNIKLEYSNPVVHTGAFAWTNIGPYSDLYLQVVRDALNNYTFNYKKLASDPWTTHAILSGYNFDQLGLITKTWHSPPPDGAVNFDYLYYNYTPPTGGVPEPATLALLGLGLAGIGFARKKKQS